VAIAQLKNAEVEAYGASFSIKVQSGRDATFGPSNVRVIQGGKQLAVLGHADFQKRLEAQKAHNEGLSMLAAVLGGANAALDRGMAAQHMQNASMLVSANNATIRDIGALGTQAGVSYWKPTQLRAGQDLSGLITVEGLEAAAFEFFIQVGPESHRLEFKPAE
jgi:hypothetical protein